MVKSAKTPRVMIVLGSSSDLPVIEGCKSLLERFGISYGVEVASAHRQPAKLHRILNKCDKNGTQVYIAVAGMAAHLPGVMASLTDKPVIGVPVAAGALAGVDALLSIAQMPGGVPVATVAIGSSGGKNAAVLSARIFALSDKKIEAALVEYRKYLAKGGK
ncbi:MAG: 5-(carboxyamino)imidazole ribonucleotide mutase [bacterium]|nr:5-(carboxyamino)imidazole ribonucleotide mutase [bacterium]MCP4799393.1 5-(carboxyamino)imidazole ribonucleotide mutase [bacterium]